MPDAGQLQKLRSHIDRKPHKLKAVLMQEGIRRSFLGGVSKDEKKVVKAFTAANKANALKKKPKDYDAGHPEIELLKLRNFTIGHKLKDDEVTSKDALARMTTLMSELEPFITYLNSAVMPDEESSDEDEDDDDQEDEQPPQLGDVDSEDPGPDPDEPDDSEPE